MNKIIIADEIVEDANGKPNMRKVILDIPFDVLLYFLKKDDGVNSYAQFSSYHISVNFWTEEFLTTPNLFRKGEDETIVTFYPYDKQEWIAKKTKRDYIKEMDLCLDYIVKLVKKIKKLEVN